MYADDSALCYAANTNKELESIISSELNLVFDWIKHQSNQSIPIPIPFNDPLLMQLINSPVLLMYNAFVCGLWY